MNATLSYERVPGAGEPSRWILMLHGIYGAGRNWGQVARRLTRRRRDWSALLVDLRQHGDSQGFPPPHTIAAAADDLADLVRVTGVRAAAVLGHSFGGKVALRYAQDAPQDLAQVWVVDSTPEARPPEGSAWNMLGALRGVPNDYASRGDAVEALVGVGIKRPVAQWMVTNLEWRDGRYRWRIDFDDMEALLRDFFDTDLWAVVEDPPAGVDLHFVRATKSSVMAQCAARIRAAAERTRVRLHDVEGGHWLNADNPDALIDLLARHLPGA
ncbi:MAG TPA: alpha/beta hydrolase [Longimicrobiales bacterium]|nr:alpha/beta hydrolase [Longimicrobiales bacterium]